MVEKQQTFTVTTHASASWKETSGQLLDSFGRPAGVGASVFLQIAFGSCSLLHRRLSAAAAGVEVRAEVLQGRCWILRAGTLKLQWKC